MSSLGQTAGQNATAGDVSGAMSSMPPQLAGMLQNLFSGGGMSNLSSPQQPAQGPGQGPPGSGGQPSPQQMAALQQSGPLPAPGVAAQGGIPTAVPGINSLLAFENATGLLGPMSGST